LRWGTGLLGARIVDKQRLAMQASTHQRCDLTHSRERGIVVRWFRMHLWRDANLLPIDKFKH
jgi:hypothetical protein